jgi:hypothetical protein
VSGEDVVAVQRIPVDTSRLDLVMCVSAPEPRVNTETGEVRADRDGNTIYVVGVVVRSADARRAETIEVAVPGQPRGVDVGMRLDIAELTAIQWTMGARSGTSFRAMAITPASGHGAGAPMSPAAAGVKGKSAPGGEN